MHVQEQGAFPGKGTFDFDNFEVERERERERERENEFFINEGNGISTVLFSIQPSGKNKTKTTTKTIENKIIN